MPAADAPPSSGAGKSTTPSAAQASKTTDGAATTATATKTAALEEDDEFEDFPVENWTQEETDVSADNAHLWEESWDDDDTTDDFSAQLKEELKKVEAIKKG